MEELLNRPIGCLKGVGKTRKEQYEKLGISTLLDLLAHYPRRYLDCTSPLTIAQAPLLCPALVKATVFQKLPVRRISGGRKLQKVMVSDGADTMTLAFFNNVYAADALVVGEEYLFYGRMTNNFAQREMTSPQVISLEEAGGFLPIYRLTKGLSNRMISNNAKEALAIAAGELPQVLPPALLETYGLPPKATAVQDVHFPPSAAALCAARKHLMLEELIVLQLALQAVRLRQKQPTKPVIGDLTPFIKQLPFALTDAQLRALNEAAADLAKDTPMARLIQGDVGSGKTVVAAGLCYLCAMAGRQAVILAPTEILATQHAQTLSSLFQGTSIEVGLLTGSMPAPQKRALKNALADGTCQVVVGTHAVLQKDVAFADLALVVTDEQHRFGVEQRSTLAQKGDHPHVLVMSATPIPRSLALVIYGDLSVSVIDTLPKGRQPIETYLVDSSKRKRMLGFAQKAVARGEQVYFVCPAIEEGEEADPKMHHVVEYHAALAGGVFPAHEVGLLHGKLPAAQKEQVMADFVAGKTKVLVTTTVIEVGVDVPNATLMIIETAERFGLSQLHQLRGRVGRGTAKSTCVLVSDDPTEETKTRLKALCATTDGFAIANEDLRQRGPGDFFGARQHGLPQLQLADLLTDAALLEVAQKEAEALVASGEIKNHRPLRQAVRQQLNTLGPGQIS